MVRIADGALLAGRLCQPVTNASFSPTTSPHLLLNLPSGLCHHSSPMEKLPLPLVLVSNSLPALNLLCWLAQSLAIKFSLSLTQPALQRTTVQPMQLFRVWTSQLRTMMKATPSLKPTSLTLLPSPRTEATPSCTQILFTVKHWQPFLSICEYLIV